jgi:hypothetical protein
MFDRALAAASPVDTIHRGPEAPVMQVVLQWLSALVDSLTEHAVAHVIVVLHIAPKPTIAPEVIRCHWQ